MKKNILVQSGSEIFVSIFKYMLSDEYTVYTASDDEETLDILSIYSMHLIICSYKQSKGDAYDIIKEIRETENGRNAPIVVLSNIVDKNIIRLASFYDVDNIIKMPTEPFDFEKKIKAILMKHAKSYEKPDEVTGLIKKQLAEEKIKEALINGQNGAMLLIELDKLSFARKSVSHEVLLTCRDIILSNLYENAIFAVMKTGGFMMFIPNLRLRKEIEEYAYAVIRETTARCTEEVYVSIGLAVTERHGENYDDLYQMCDLGLGKARQDGKNTACFYKW